MKGESVNFGIYDYIYIIFIFPIWWQGGVKFHHLIHNISKFGYKMENRI